MPDFSNLFLLRLAALELCRAADPNLSHYCLLVSWNDVADAATIAALQMPVGFDFGSGDVFPSSVSVARSVAADFVAARTGSRA